MIKQIKLDVCLENSAGRLHYNWGYALYGMLAQRAERDYMARLHEQNFTPINQYLTVKANGQEGVWTINLLGQEAVEQIAPILRADDSWYSEYHQASLKVKAIHESPLLSEEEFCAAVLTAQQAVPRRVKLIFKTPCGFKSQERYQIFPSTDLIVKSLLRNWQGFAQAVFLDDEDTRQQLIDYSHIVDYQLRSCKYPLKGVRIPAFIGSLTLSIAGPDALARLYFMLLNFSQYSGLGIKTALGMGGCALEVIR